MYICMYIRKDIFNKQHYGKSYVMTILLYCIFNLIQHEDYRNKNLVQKQEKASLNVKNTQRNVRENFWDRNSNAASASQRNYISLKDYYVVVNLEIQFIWLPHKFLLLLKDHFNCPHLNLLINLN